MTSETVLIKKLFAKELNRCCEERYQVFPSNEKLSRDLYFSSKYKLKVNRETIRKWLKGETFPDLDCLLHLIELLGLKMSNVFLTNTNESDGYVYSSTTSYFSDSLRRDVTSEQIDLVISFLHRIKKISVVQKELPECNEYE
jgi:DNA-binding XRE family transcriptional regulator